MQVAVAKVWLNTGNKTLKLRNKHIHDSPTKLNTIF